jgi:hypothetical protein
MQVELAASCVEIEAYYFHPNANYGLVNTDAVVMSEERMVA